MTVYNYIYNGLEPLKQGDILRNIQYISPEFLIKSTPDDNKPTQNQSNEILTQVITQGDIIQIETFISSTFGILATQDCDIRPEYNLTFLLNVEYFRCVQQYLKNSL